MLSWRRTSNPCRLGDHQAGPDVNRPRYQWRQARLFGGLMCVIMAACGAPAAAPATLPPTLPPPTAPPTTAPIAPTATAQVAAPTATAQPTLTATPGPRQPDSATEAGTLAAGFESALNSGDVEGALALFDAVAEVKVPPDRYVGLGQVRDWVTYLAANHFAIEPGFRRVVGDRAIWPAEVRSDYLDHIGLPSLQGTASLTVHEGLIQSYTFVLTEDSAHRHRAAQLAASQVLQDPVIVGQDAANVYGFSDVFRDSTGQLLSYRDVLLAEPGSGPFFDLGGEPIIIRSGL